MGSACFQFSEVFLATDMGDLLNLCMLQVDFERRILGIGPPHTENSRFRSRLRISSQARSLLNPHFACSNTIDRRGFSCVMSNKPKMVPSTATVKLRSSITRFFPNVLLNPWACIAACLYTVPSHPEVWTQFSENQTMMG